MNKDHTIGSIEFGPPAWKGEPYPAQPGLVSFDITVGHGITKSNLMAPADTVSLPRDWVSIIKEHNLMRDALIAISTKQMMKCELIGLAKETAAKVEKLG